jgi:hypothetical protein
MTLRPRGAYIYGHDAYSQHTYNKDYEAYKKKKKCRARQSAAVIAGGGDGGGGGGGCCSIWRVENGVEYFGFLFIFFSFFF